MIENNDTSVKAEVNDKFDTQERNMTQMSTDLMNGAAANQVVTNASVKILEDNSRHEFNSIENTLNSQTGRLGQTEMEGQSVANKIAMIEISISTLQTDTVNETNALKTQMSTVPNATGFGQGFGQK